jgi:hypothetical protein
LPVMADLVAVSKCQNVRVVIHMRLSG